MEPTLYDILHVSEDATKADIRKAYKKMANKTHPDKEEGSEEKFQAVKNAYMILHDEELRERYNKTGQTDKPTGEPTLAQKAMSALAEVFTRVLRKNIERVGRMDLVAVSEKQIAGNKSRLKAEFVKMKEMPPKFEAVLERLSNKKAESNPILEGVIQKELDGIKANLKDGEEKLKQLDLMLEYLEDYDYRIDVFEQYEQAHSSKAGWSTTVNPFLNIDTSV